MRVFVRQASSAMMVMLKFTQFGKVLLSTVLHVHLEYKQLNHSFISGSLPPLINIKPKSSLSNIIAKPTLPSFSADKASSSLHSRISTLRV